MRFALYTTLALSFISSALALPSARSDNPVADAITSLIPLVANSVEVIQNVTLHASLSSTLSLQAEFGVISKAVGAVAVVVSQAPLATEAQAKGILVVLRSLATESLTVFELVKPAIVVIKGLIGADIGILRGVLVDLETSIGLFKAAVSDNLSSDFRDISDALFVQVDVELQVLIVLCG